MISNPKPDLYNINAPTKFDENALIFTLRCRPEMKMAENIRLTKMNIYGSINIIRLTNIWFKHILFQYFH